MKKIISYALLTAIFLSSTGYTQAAELEEDATAEYSQSSNFSVSLPKNIALNADRRGTYSVRASGDIAGDEQVIVNPIDDVDEVDGINFLMKNDGISREKKDDVTATVTQDKVSWIYSDLGTVGSGEIQAGEMSAGSWRGTLNFEIGLNEYLIPASPEDNENNSEDKIEEDNEEDEEIEESKDAGLYVANADSYISWQELIDNGTILVEDDKFIGFGDTELARDMIGSQTDILRNMVRKYIGDSYYDSWSGTTTLVDDMSDSMLQFYVNIMVTDAVDFYYNEFDLENKLKEQGLTDIEINEYKTNTLYNNMLMVLTNSTNSIHSEYELVIPGTINSVSGINNTSNIKSIILQDGVETIEESAITDNLGLVDIKLSSTLTTIKDNGLKNNSITSLIIPKNVQNIATNSFTGLALNKLTNKSELTDENNWGASINISEINHRIENNMFIMNNIIYDYTGTETEIEIPDGIKKIASEAFYGTDIESLIIPDSVTSIGREAFCSCYSLADISIPDSVIDIGYDAFYNTEWLDLMREENPFVIINNILIDASAYEGETLEIPDGVVKITDGHNYYAKRIIIPEGVTSIGDYAFYYSDVCESIEIPESVTKIGECAFSDCAALKRVSIPNGVEVIEYETFAYCYSLEGVYIPESVNEIKEYAFYECNELWDVTIENPNIIIDETAFINTLYGSDGLVIEDNIVVDGSECKGTVIIPEGVTTIDYDAFGDNTELKSVVLPNTITSIGESAFEGCSNLKKINIPASVIEIGEHAFSDDTNLNLTTDSVLDNIISVGYEAFSDTLWLNLQRDENPLVRCGKVIIDGKSCSGDIVIPEDITSIASNAFYGNTSVNSISMSNNITSIGASAFRGCRNLTTVNLSNRIEMIEDWTFEGCYLLENIQLPETITRIGPSSFKDCRKLTEMIIPSNVERIESDAFRSCVGLRDIIIPSNVTTISMNAFRYSNLETIYCEAESKPSGWSSEWNYDCSANVIWGYTGE